MAVLKRHDAVPTLAGSVVMDLADFKAEGLRLLAEARAESERLLREARIAAAKVRSDAAESGRAEGFAAGREEGFALGREEGAAAARSEVAAAYRAELAELAERWNAALGRWEEARSRLFREARAETIRLSLAIAERIVRRAVAADPSLVVERLDGALELLGAATSVTVACRPEDRALLAASMPTLAERLGRTVDCAFVEDPELAPGDVIVRVPEGSVDASLAAQLDRLADALLPGDAAAGGSR
jgi:flagellar assembly protein FliH